MNGQRLVELRKAAGLTQAELAVKAGLGMMQVSRIERGAVSDPQVSTVQALAEALGVPVAELLADPQPEAAAR